MKNTQKIKYVIIFAISVFGLFIATGIYKLIDQGFYVYHEVSFKDHFVYETGDYTWENHMKYNPKKLYEDIPLYEMNNTYPITYNMTQQEVTVYRTVDGKSYIKTNGFAMFFGGKYE